jgi:hypothetical protein
MALYGRTRFAETKVVESKAAERDFATAVRGPRRHAVT